MMFNVPQFIDVEDKIAGPLTWRQLLWMIGMGAALLVFFNMFGGVLFVLVAVPTVLLFVAFAFYRPNGFPMTTFIFHAILFLFRPKISVWERPTRVRPQPKPHAPYVEPLAPGSKQVDRARLSELARILDRHGKA